MMRTRMLNERMLAKFVEMGDFGVFWKNAAIPLRYKMQLLILILESVFYLYISRCLSRRLSILVFLWHCLFYYTNISKHISVT